jgi:hypothetical protein
LARQRRDGASWSDRRFDLIVQKALVGASYQEKADWHAAFRSTRRVWKAAYRREVDWTYRLSPALLEREPDDESLASSRFVLIR